MRCLILTSLAVAVLAASTPVRAQAGNIDSTQRHAWSESSGWLDFRPDYGGVTVYPTHLAGYAWHENVGWVKLGADAGGPYANVTALDWGVNLSLVTGALSGFAWSENAGWIRMDPAFGGVAYDAVTRQLNGWAWSESLGWIHFRSVSPTAYGVTVDCGGLSGTVSGGGTTCEGGGSGVTVAVAVAGGVPPYAVTLDNGGGTQSGPGPVFSFLVSPAVTTTYSVASLSDGLSCGGAGSGSATAIVNETPLAPTPSNNGPACEGSTVQLDAGFVATAAYQWSGPNGFASEEMLPTLPDLTPAMGGDYHVAVTVNGCTSPAGTTTVVVRPRPAMPSITAPAGVWPEQPFMASVPSVAGVNYAWTVTNGTLTAGAGTPEISVTAGSTGPVGISVVETDAFTECASAEASVSIPAALATTRFFPLSPCRLFDTRDSEGASAAAPALAPGETRTLAVGSRCGIAAASVRSLSVNLTVTQQTADGDLVVYRGDLNPDPITSSISFRTGRDRANNGLLEFSRVVDGTVKVRNRSNGPVHFILDVNGYFR